MWFLKEYLGIGRIKNSVLFNTENNDSEKIEELKNIIRENTNQNEVVSKIIKSLLVKIIKSNLTNSFLYFKTMSFKQYIGMFELSSSDITFLFPSIISFKLLIWFST